MGSIRTGFRILVRNPATFYRYVRRLLRPIRADYRKRLRMRLSEWLLFHEKHILNQECRWMGLHALKNPLDAWIYQEIVYEVRPEIVIEIGSSEGGSTLYLAGLLELLGNGRVVSIDIDRTRFRAKHDRIIEITGSSSSPEIVEEVRRLCQGKTVLTIQDGAHDKQSVLKDLRNYSKLVSLHSYFIVEDGIVDFFKPRDGVGSFEDGPLAAIDEFLSENTSFVVDSERERYILTANPRGFLKRIR